jgi:elongation factor G
MEDIPIERIRNVVLLSHNGAGTTTLAEALMARAGATARVGSVDSGTSVLDSDPESVKRQMSLSLALAPFRWTAPDGVEYQVNLIDVPGYADFVGAAEAAMAVADLAVLVVSAVDGVEVQTEMLWRRAVARGLPRMVFVTKEDRERADFHRVLHQLQTVFGSGFAPLELPIGEAQALHGIADVLSEQAFEYEAGGAHHVQPMPADIADEEHRLHDSVVEEIVSGDDDQLERYLSGEVPSVADLERTLRHEVLDCLEFPVLLGSSTTGVGIDRLADFICELGPSPADRSFTVQAGGQAVDVTADSSAAPLLHVFATVADPYVGQLSLFKVLTGKVRADDVLHNPRSGTDEKLHNLFSLRGREQTAITLVGAGNIAAVSRLAGTRTFDTLTTKSTPVHVAPPPMPIPQYAVAIVPRTQADDDKLGVALGKLQAEDPVLLVSRDDETHQTVLRAMGDTHVAVTLERLSRLFGVQVDTEPLRIAYRETIGGEATVEGKLKKQSGGHGQFAIANLRVGPLPRGSGFEFIDSVVGGAIPRNLVPAVQRGVEEALVAGGPHGYPVVDVRVECFDGKFHPVDSSEMAFKTAAALGLHEAMAKAGTVVLEPIAEVRVAVPPAQQGDVMGDLTSRRGRVMGTEVGHDGQQTIVAHVPAAEIARYAVDLRSITGGRGEYTASHDHYDVLPEPLAAKLPRPQSGRKV